MYVKKPRTPAQLAADARLRERKQTIFRRRDAERQQAIEDMRDYRTAFNAERVARGLVPYDFTHPRFEQLPPPQTK